MKAKKFIMAAMLASVFMLGSTGRVMEVEAACSGYTEYKADEAYCDNEDGCGFLWLDDTLKYKSYQERYCDLDGEQKRFERTTYIKISCC